MVRTHTLRLAAGVLAGGVLLAPTAGCSGDGDPSSAPAGGATLPDTPASGSAGDGAGDPGVNCADGTCSVTLPGDGTTVEVLGTPISLGDVQDGTATVGVGENAEVSCREDQSVTVVGLTLECTTVSEERVVLSVSLG